MCRPVSQRRMAKKIAGYATWIIKLVLKKRVPKSCIVLIFGKLQDIWSPQPLPTFCLCLVFPVAGTESPKQGSERTM